jgi:HPt (histidine-containing phosphotransfer) domain-containing protein
MRYAPLSLNAALVEAVGDDPALVADLRAAFLAGARDHLDLMIRAANDAEWCLAAWKLQGLAASFGAGELMALAEEAAQGRPRAADLPERIERAIGRFAG